MLTRLSVRQVVLIEKLDLNFESGLAVFTGETGAGKSILLDSLSLALGTRADAGLVRQGEKEASVTACFSVPMSHASGVLLTEHGMAFDGEIILRRTITADGRSRAFINDEPVSVGFLRTVGDTLVEIHGQFASHRLLNPATHLDTLDAYGALADLEADCRRAYQMWRYKKEQRDAAEQNLMQAQKDEAYLRDSVADLERLNPRPDEEEALIQRRTTLMNSEKIVTALNTAYALLADDENGCARQLGEALAQLEHANAWADQALSGITEQVSQATALLEDAAATLEKSTADFGDVSELPTIDDRLFALRDMARKHQVDIAELPNVLEQMKEKLSQVDKGATTIADFARQEEQARLAYMTCAEKLSLARGQAAERLDASVGRELPALKLGKAVFQTAVERLPDTAWSATGVDKVAFLVSTNKGTPLMPINKVASGGELARFMLALKVNLADTDDVNTLVFDEVDSGVGGATAAAVGARLARLGQTHQVLVVTHSPQVAAHGATHFTVRKEETPAGVLTTVDQLTDQARTDELARMLSGASVTQTARTMAQELLDTCSKT